MKFSFEFVTVIRRHLFCRFSYFLCLFLFPVFSFSQEVRKSKYLSLGSRHIGIGFGNPEKYSGLRFALYDMDDDSSGNLTGKINGIDIGAISYDYKSNGIRLGILVTGAENMNGINLGGFCAYSRKLNGVGFGLTMVTDTLNGIGAGLFIFGSTTSPCGRYRICVMNGVAAGMTIFASKVRGLAVGVGNVTVEEVKGVTVCGLINKAENLHGLQIGLLNYAGNNPKIFRWMPFVNFHL